MKISKKLKELRKENQLTQGKLAELSGINHSAIRKYEIDINVPQDQHIQNLAKTFNISPLCLKSFDSCDIKLDTKGDLLATLVLLIKSGFLEYSLDKTHHRFTLKLNSKLENVLSIISELGKTLDLKNTEMQLKDEILIEDFYSWLCKYTEIVKLKQEEKEIPENLKNEIEEIEFNLMSLQEKLTQK